RPVASRRRRRRGPRRRGRPAGPAWCAPFASGHLIGTGDTITIIGRRVTPLKPPGLARTSHGTDKTSPVAAGPAPPRGARLPDWGRLVRRPGRRGAGRAPAGIPRAAGAVRRAPQESNGPRKRLARG